MSFFYSSSMQVRGPNLDHCRFAWKTISDTLGAGLTRVGSAADMEAALTPNSSVGNYKSGLQEIYLLAGSTPLYMLIAYTYATVTTGWYVPQVEIQYGSALNSASTGLAGTVTVARNQGWPARSSTGAVSADFLISALATGVVIIFGVTRSPDTGTGQHWGFRLADPSTNSPVGDFLYGVGAAPPASGNSSVAVTNYDGVGNTTASISQLLTIPDFINGGPTLSPLYSGDNGMTPDARNFVPAGPFINMNGRLWSTLNPGIPIRWMPAGAGPAMASGVMEGVDWFALPSSINPTSSPFYVPTGQTVWIRR